MNEPTFVFLFYGILGIIAWLSQSLHNEKKRRIKAESMLAAYQSVEQARLREAGKKIEEQNREAKDANPLS